MSGNSNGMQKCPSREELMKRIKEHSFAVDDLLLYLDTHPDCQAGMAYYRRALAANRQAVARYEQA